MVFVIIRCYVVFLGCLCFVVRLASLVSFFLFLWCCYPAADGCLFLCLTRVHLVTSSAVCVRFFAFFVFLHMLIITVLCSPGSLLILRFCCPEYEVSIFFQCATFWCVVSALQLRSLRKLFACFFFVFFLFLVFLCFYYSWYWTHHFFQLLFVFFFFFSRSFWFRFVSSVITCSFFFFFFFLLFPGSLLCSVLHLCFPWAVLARVLLYSCYL